MTETASYPYSTSRNGGSTPFPTAPGLTGRAYALRNLEVSDHLALYHFTVSHPEGFRWRYRGVVPSFEAFQKSLYPGVHCQFLVSPLAGSSSLSGLVVAYNANLQDGYCYVATILDPQAAGAFEGVILFIRYLMDHWPFRKLYFEALEFNVGQYGSGVRSGLLVEEGRLKAHEYVGGKYWDTVILASYRDAMETYYARLAATFADSRPTSEA